MMYNVDRGKTKTISCIHIKVVQNKDTSIMKADKQREAQEVISFLVSVKNIKFIMEPTKKMRLIS